MKKGIALLLLLSLCLCLALPAPADTLRLTAEDSRLLPDAVFSTLQAVFDTAALQLNAAGCALLCGTEPLLWVASDGRIGSGDTVAPLALPQAGMQTLPQTVSALFELLQPFAQEQTRAIDLQEAGTCNRQLVSVLSDAEWSQTWNTAVDILTDLTPAAEALRGATITGKATFKRYFDKEGRAMGAYFYTEAFTLDGETREVRLEYAFRAGRGAFLAFRCPNAKQTQNLRVSLHAASRNEKTTLSGDIRRTDGKNTDVLTLSGSTKKLTLTLTRKGQPRYALILSDLAEGTCRYAFETDGKLLLAGSATLDRVSFTPPALPVNADSTQLLRVLTQNLARRFAVLPQEGAWQLLHLLGRAQFAQGEATTLRLNERGTDTVTEEGN